VYELVCGQAGSKGIKRTKRELMEKNIDEEEE